MDHEVEASAPCRVALIGDHLDWLSGEAITCALREIGYTLRVQCRTKGVDPTWPERPNSKLLSSVLAAMREYAPWLPKIQVTVLKSAPSGAGLGSSATFCVAVAAAVNCLCELALSPLQVASIAVQAERLANIAGGQMDQYTAALGGVRGYWFRDFGLSRSVSFSFPRHAMIVLAQSKRRPSGQIVSRIQTLARIDDPGVREFRAKGRDLFERLRSALQCRHPDLRELGQMLDAVHFNLRDNLDVSLPHLERLTTVARQAGAYGAKLTGAGHGGTIFALCDSENAATVACALRDEGAPVYVCTPSSSGVSTWSDEGTGK